jgi:hypothetical protein
VLADADAKALVAQLHMVDVDVAAQSAIDTEAEMLAYIAAGISGRPPCDPPARDVASPPPSPGDSDAGARGVVASPPPSSPGDSDPGARGVVLHLTHHLRRTRSRQSRRGLLLKQGANRPPVTPPLRLESCLECAQPTSQTNQSWRGTLQ